MTRTIEQRREAERRYYRKHRALVLAKQKAWRDSHPSYSRDWHERNAESVSIAHKALYAAKPEVASARGKQWKAANKDRVDEFSRRRRARKLRAIPPWSETTEIELLSKKRNELNRRLGLTGKDKLCVDHIIPLFSKTVCGLHCMANLQLLSYSENSAKHNTYQSEW